MEKLHYGIIGSGTHALQGHAQPASTLEGLELTAICDISKDSMRQFEAGYGQELQHFTDRKHFLNSRIGAVLIATPDEAHFVDMQAALDAGRHVFVEKPVAVTVADTEKLRGTLEDANQAGLVVSSCHPRRFDPPYMWLKNALPALSDELGQPLEFQFDFSYVKPRRQWKHDRGLLLDHANHEIDLAHYYFGRSGFEASRLTDSYDRYHISGMRDDGIAFNFRGTRRLNEQHFKEWARVRFEMGEVALAAHSGAVTVANHDTGNTEQVAAPSINYAQRGLGIMANFKNAVLGNEPNYLDPEDIYVNTATSVMLSEQPTWRYENGNS
jgi:predicted dehydrogenase